MAYGCGIGLFFSSANLLYLFLMTSYDTFHSERLVTEVHTVGMVLHVTLLLILNLYAAWISKSFVRMNSPLPSWEPRTYRPN